MRSACFATIIITGHKGFQTVSCHEFALSCSPFLFSLFAFRFFLFHTHIRCFSLPTQRALLRLLLSEAQCLLDGDRQFMLESIVRLIWRKIKTVETGNMLA